MKQISSLIITVISLALIAVLAYADGIHHDGIRLDGTIGTHGKLDLPGPDYEIKAEYGHQAGSNLFHSFQKFSIHSDESATFSGPADVHNIVSRVTGGDSSWIDGKLGSAISGANLYLLNPAGVMFGPNASLNLGGSFHVSTADYLRMGDNELLYSEPGESDVLSAAAPTAFGFIGDNPTEISFEKSFIEVPEGETLSVTGGDIRMHDSTLFARGGNISLVSTASEGQVKFGNRAKADGCAKLGTIRISRDSAFKKYNESTYFGDIEVSGMEKGHDSGEVFIRGERFEIKGGFVDANTRGEGDAKGISVRVTQALVLEKGALESGTYSSGNAGNIAVEAKEVSVTKGGYITSSSVGTGNSGNISISADTLSISGNNGIYNSGILAETYGQGKGGSVTLSALRIVADKGGMIKAGTSGTGSAGEIRLDADTLDIRGEAQISANTYGKGDAGRISILADDSVSISGENYFGGIYANTYDKGKGGIITISAPRASVDKGGMIKADTSGDGNAGEITFNVNALNATGGAQISSSTFGSGYGGAVSILADSVNISGANDYISSGIYSDNHAEGVGGYITVSASEVTMDNNGTIAARTRGDRSAGEIRLNLNTLSLTSGAHISTDTYGKGRGGTISISAAESVSISGQSEYFNSGLVSRTLAGKGGSVILSSPALALDDNGVIEAQTLGEGSGGDIKLDLGVLTLANGGTIRTQTMHGSGTGGNIRITASDSVSISGKGDFSSGLHATSILGSGIGGNIFLFAPDLKLDNNGIIEAEASGTGRAGLIKLDVSNLTLTNGALVSTDTFGKGLGGEINIFATDSVNISGKGEWSSGLYSNTYPGGDRQGGSITLSTADLKLDKQGKIQAATGGDGNAGKIRLNANELAISGGARVSTETIAGGDGGNIELHTARLSMENKSSVTTESTGTGKGGHITIRALQTISMNDSSVTTATLQSDGGDMTINTGTRLDLANSRITTSVQGGAGNGGNISIDPDSVIMNRSKIIANAHGGNGGNIHIVADRFVRSYDSTVSASSKLGINGLVEIESPDDNIISSLTLMPYNFPDAARWMKTPCSARASENTSHFVIKTWDAAPASFLDLQPSMLPVADNPCTSLTDVSYMTPYLKLTEMFVQEKRWLGSSDDKDGMK